MDLSHGVYYGIVLDMFDFVDNCNSDFIFRNPFIKNIKDWIEICDIFHQVQIKNGIDYNIIKILLKLYNEDNYLYMYIPQNKLKDSIDKYGYSSFNYDPLYDVNYDFCELRFQYIPSKDVNRIIKEGAVLCVEIDNNYSSFKFFIIEELLQNEKIIKFNKGIKNHPKLNKFKPGIIVKD